MLSTSVGVAATLFLSLLATSTPAPMITAHFHKYLGSYRVDLSLETILITSHQLQLQSNDEAHPNPSRYSSLMPFNAETLCSAFDISIMAMKLAPTNCTGTGTGKRDASFAAKKRHPSPQPWHVAPSEFFTRTLLGRNQNTCTPMSPSQMNCALLLWGFSEQRGSATSTP